MTLPPPNGPAAPPSATPTDAPPPIDIRGLEPLLMSRVARGECTWPWLVQFLQSLTRAVRVSVRPLPPHRGEGNLDAHAAVPPPAMREVLDRQDDELVATVCREGKTQVRKTVLGGEQVTQMGTPLTGAGGGRGAMILWVLTRPEQAVEPFLVALQLVAGFGQMAATTRGSGVDSRLAASLSTLSAHVLETRNAAAVRQIFADELPRLTGCDAAALAVGHGGIWEAVAVAGAVRFDPSGPMANAIASALHGLTFTPSPASPPAPADAVPAGMSELARQWDCRVVRPWLFPDTGPGPAVAFLLGFRQATFSAADLDRLLGAAAPGWAALLGVSRRLGPAGASRELIGGLLRPLASVRWLLVLVAAALMTYALIRPVPWSIRVGARVQSLERRTVSAPSDGTLRLNHVQLGQEVEAGQPLGELDDSEIRLALSEAKASRERARAQHAAAMSRDEADAARGELARLDAEVAEIEIRLLEYRLDHLTLTSPVSGTVLRESSRLAGARVPLGQPLYEIASAGGTHLELDVPDHRISHVHEGQEVEVYLESFPGRTWKARISRLHPQSEVREGANLFVAEATPEETVSEWKPGMRGRGAIRSEPRPLGWILFHPVGEFIEWILFR